MIGFFEIPRHLDELKDLRDNIEVACSNLPEEFSHEAILGCFEAVTNIIRHTELPLANSPIGVTIEKLPNGISIVLEYEGNLFVPPKDPKPDFSGNSDGGFGLFIIQNCFSEIQYDSPKPGLSQIILIKNIS